jgi:hypothetical protein
MIPAGWTPTDCNRPTRPTPPNMLSATVEVILGVLLGWAIAASVLAGFRLIRRPRVISNEQRLKGAGLALQVVTGSRLAFTNLPRGRVLIGND